MANHIPDFKQQLTVSEQWQAAAWGVHAVKMKLVACHCCGTASCCCRCSRQKEKLPGSIHDSKCSLSESSIACIDGKGWRINHYSRIALWRRVKPNQAVNMSLLTRRWRCSLVWSQMEKIIILTKARMPRVPIPLKLANVSHRGCCFSSCHFKVLGYCSVMQIRWRLVAPIKLTWPKSFDISLSIL